MLLYNTSLQHLSTTVPFTKVPALPKHHYNNTSTNSHNTKNTTPKTLTHAFLRKVRTQHQQTPCLKGISLKNRNTNSLNCTKAIPASAKTARKVHFTCAASWKEETSQHQSLWVYYAQAIQVVNLRHKFFGSSIPIKQLIAEVRSHCSITAYHFGKTSFKKNRAQSQYHQRSKFLIRSWRRSSLFTSLPSPRVSIMLRSNDGGSNMEKRTSKKFAFVEPMLISTSWPYWSNRTGGHEVAKSASGDKWLKYFWSVLKSKWALENLIYINSKTLLG